MRAVAAAPFASSRWRAGVFLFWSAVAAAFAPFATGFENRLDGHARVEGADAGDWVLIDTGDIIVHVFRPEIREFYNIEKMWAAPDLDEGTLH